jgi:hypothetical protein
MQKEALDGVGGSTSLVATGVEITGDQNRNHPVGFEGVSLMDFIRQ